MILRKLFAKIASLHFPYCLNFHNCQQTINYLSTKDVTGDLHLCYCEFSQVLSPWTDSVLQCLFHSLALSSHEFYELKLLTLPQPPIWLCLTRTAVTATQCPCFQSLLVFSLVAPGECQRWETGTCPNGMWGHRREGSALVHSLVLPLSDATIATSAQATASSVLSCA